ncbi:acyltransferase family protein [Neisseriaceae bacterium CLB008]
MIYNLGAVEAAIIAGMAFIPYFLILFFKNKTICDELLVSAKYEYLDSLRGIAATFVLIHHSRMIYNFHSIGVFTDKGVFSYSSSMIEKIFGYMGSGSVMIFFMITGFLFFDKLLKDGGFEDARSFYIKRVNRLLPAILGSLVFAIVISLFFGVNCLNNNAFGAVISWLSFGFIRLIPITNSLPDGLMVAGVFWTLAIEWKFYFIIPFLSIFTKELKFALISVLIMASLVILCIKFNLLTERDATILACFILGFIAAVLNRLLSVNVLMLVGGWLFATLAVALVMYVTYAYPESYNVRIALSLFFILFSVVNNNSFLGVLSFKPLVLAGKASYSIYITHGIVLNFVCGYLLKGSPYYATFIVAAFLVSVISVLFYFKIERPFMIRPVGIKKK